MWGRVFTILTILHWEPPAPVLGLSGLETLSCLRDKAPGPRNKNRPVNYNPSLKQMDKKASI